MAAQPHAWYTVVPLGDSVMVCEQASSVLEQGTAGTARLNLLLVGEMLSEAQWSNQPAATLVG